jgi:hypothetical protein
MPGDDDTLDRQHFREVPELNGLRNLVEADLGAAKDDFARAAAAADTGRDIERAIAEDAELIRRVAQGIPAGEPAPACNAMEWTPAKPTCCGPGWVHLPGLELGEHDRLRVLLEREAAMARAVEGHPTIASHFQPGDAGLLARAAQAIGPPF